MKMHPDTERILGQISRGEINVTAEAAVTIAAKAEESYGAVFSHDRDHSVIMGGEGGQPL